MEMLKKIYIKRTLAEISPWGPQNAVTITSNFFMVYNVLATSYSFYSSQSAIEIMN